MIVGTDPLIHGLTARLSNDMSITLASLHTMRMDPVLRLRAAELVLPSKDTKVGYIHQLGNYLISPLGRTFYM